jgi:glycosyltransferase involved in cell wall biosynthesis
MMIKSSKPGNNKRLSTELIVKHIKKAVNLLECPDMTVLSVVLATHNEVHNLKHCLAAINDLAEEIVIVDGESSDGTVQLAQQLGARVIQTSNKPNFHINKQMAMDEARGYLVLQLDADEIVDEELHTFVAKLKQEVVNNSWADQPVAWYLRRKNHLFNRWLSKGGQYPDPVVRLYLNGKARLPQKDVHEQMLVDGKTATAPGHLLHFANPTFSDYMRKFNTYTSFAATQLEDQVKVNHRQPFVLSYLCTKPIQTFFSIYIRHRGYVDGMAGFVFALMSALHHPFVYLKYWELREVKKAT